MMVGISRDLASKSDGNSNAGHEPKSEPIPSMNSTWEKFSPGALHGVPGASTPMDLAPLFKLCRRSCAREAGGHAMHRVPCCGLSIKLIGLPRRRMLENSTWSAPLPKPFPELSILWLQASEPSDSLVPLPARGTSSAPVEQLRSVPSSCPVFSSFEFLIIKLARKRVSRPGNTAQGLHKHCATCDQLLRALLTVSPGALQRLAAI